MLAELRRKLTHKKNKPSVWQDFKFHHNTMKYMNANKAHTRRKFDQGHVHIICDYSMNGTLGRLKKEHASRFFQAYGYSLFGMVVDARVEDRLDLNETEKNRLIALLEEHHPGQPHVITEMHCILTADNLHDSSAVIHFMNAVLLPFLAKTIDGITDGGVAHFCNDGAPNQFANKDIFNWVSKAKSIHKIIVDWVIGCAAHGLSFG